MVDREELISRPIAMFLWGGSPLSYTISIPDLSCKVFANRNVPMNFTVRGGIWGFRWLPESVIHYFRQRARDSVPEDLAQCFFATLRSCCDDLAQESKMGPNLLGFSVVVEATRQTQTDQCSFAIEGKHNYGN